MKTLCFTGHRPGGLPFGENTLSPRFLLFQTKLLQLIDDKIKDGYDTFLTGCAMGADLIAADAVLKWRLTTYPDLRLICVEPFPDYAARWTGYWREKYERVTNSADEVISTGEVYTPACYDVRNRYMVDNSQALIAIYNGSETGGTYNTIRYAMKCGREITVIDVNTMTVHATPPVHK